MKTFTFIKQHFTKYLLMSFMLFIGYSIMAQTATVPSGSGTSGSPYQIASLENLYWIAASDVVVPSPNHATRWAAYYEQTNNIDASPTSGWFSGAGWTPIGYEDASYTGISFTGSYDGQEHTITGLSINNTTLESAGLFGVTDGATIENLGMVNVSIYCQYNGGGLIGDARASNINNCFTTGTVSTPYSEYSFQIGGFIGVNEASTISNAYSSCSVSSYSIFGGFIGYNDGIGIVNNCYFSGSVSPTSGYLIGGFIGYDAGSGSFSHNFWDIEESGTTDGAGWQDPDPSDITGKSTAQMQTASTFTAVGWSTSYWSLADGSYPKLFIHLIKPTVTTQAVTSISVTTATGNGNITDLGVPNPSAYGVCWNTSTGPTTSNSKVDKGASSATGAFTASITSLSAGSLYYVRAFATNTAGTAYGDEVTFTTLTAGTWTGTTNTSWGTSTNWAGGSVPTSATDVTIPSGLINYPTISATTSADCNNLTVISGGSLTIESTASGTGSLIVSGTPSGNVMCQRYITGGKWHLVSPTAAGGSISTFIQAAGNAVPSKDVSGTLNYGMMDYNETPNLWNSYFTAATSDNFVAGKGYSTRRSSDGIVTFTGTLTSGTRSVSLTKVGEGWNCVGNPYTSAIKMNTAASASNNFLKTNAIDASNLDLSYACLYVWDDAVAAYKILGNSSYGVRDLGQNIFAPGQGFFVKANSSGSSVQFTAAMQAHLPATELKAAQVSWPGFELTATSGNIKASAVVAFNKSMTNGLDPTYDAGLLRGSSGISIYTRLVIDNGVDFAIQCLPENQNQVIPLGLDCIKGGNVRFSVATSSLPKTCSIILEDRINKTFTQLDNGKELVTTVANNTKGTGRFFIYINYTGIGTSKLLSTGTFNLKVYQANGLIWIIGEVDIATKAYLYDMKGRNRGTFTLQKGSVNNLSAKGLAPGVYLLNVTEGNKRYTTKVVLFHN